MNEKMRDLLELAALGDIQNAVSAIVECVASVTDGTESGVSGDDAGELNRLLHWLRLI